MKDGEKLRVRTTYGENNCECTDWDSELKAELARQAGKTWESVQQTCNQGKMKKIWKGFVESGTELALAKHRGHDREQC